MIITIIINSVFAVIILNSAECTIQRDRDDDLGVALTFTSRRFPLAASLDGFTFKPDQDDLGLGAHPQRGAPGARAVARIHLQLAPPA